MARAVISIPTTFLAFCAARKLKRPYPQPISKTDLVLSRSSLIVLYVSVWIPRHFNFILMYLAMSEKSSLYVFGRF